MTRLPTLTPRQVIAALSRAGFVEDHQTGSHVILFHPIHNRVTVVAIHSRDLPRPTLRLIIRQAGMTTDQFRALL